MIRADYKPPVQLQIDRASRAAFAKQSYATKYFILTTPTTQMSIDWLESLDVHSSAPVKKLKFPVFPMDQHTGNCAAFDWMTDQLVELWRPITIHGKENRLPLNEECGYWIAELDLTVWRPDVLPFWEWYLCMIFEWVFEVLEAMFG